MSLVTGIEKGQPYVVPTIPSNSDSTAPVLDINLYLTAVIPPKTKSWSERAVAHLEHYEQRLDDKIPNSLAQKKIDALGLAIEKKFAPLQEFSRWLDSNGEGKWHLKLATFLWKLPVRAIRNVIRLLYSIVKCALTTAIHPMQSTIQLAKLLVLLTRELSQPNTWSKMGAGLIGASLGESLIYTNPLSAIGIAIGASLMLGGLTMNALKSAVQKEHGSFWQSGAHQLLRDAQELPESALTGMCMSLVLGGIYRAISKSRIDKLNEFVNKIIKDQQMFPCHCNYTYDPATEIITIQGRFIDQIKGIKFEILPNSTFTSVEGTVYLGGRFKPYYNSVPTDLQPLNHLTLMRHPFAPQPAFGTITVISGAASTCSDKF